MEQRTVTVLFTASKVYASKTYANGTENSNRNSNNACYIMPQTVHCNNMSAIYTKPNIAQCYSLIGRTSMQGQTSPLSSVHWPLPILILSSTERSVSKHVSTSSTCGWCSSLCVTCTFVILLLLAAPFRRLYIQGLRSNAGVDCWDKGSRYSPTNTDTNIKYG